MLIHPWDAATSGDEWHAVLRQPGHDFGQLIAAGHHREVPVVVPTQFVLDGQDTVLLHLARPNPVWAAIVENPMVLLSIAGDWAYIPGVWKAIGEEDPALGVPTTYYAAVQLTCRATVVDDADGKAEILRRQLAWVEPDGGLVDPAVHARRLSGIRGLRLSIRDVAAKFKYGGNVDASHRSAVADRLAARRGPGDGAALAHLQRRSATGG